ncbi:hypothetical protein VTN96DRAFT_7480 [Rasamsonia emersonii]
MSGEFSSSQGENQKQTQKQEQNQNQQRYPTLKLNLNLQLETPSPSDKKVLLQPKKVLHHPNFFATLHHLSRPLCPLVSITTGRAHPSFPRTILAYHLLTSTQLDDLARHYHQIWPPVPETFGYPIRVRAWIGTPEEKSVDIETKRRRIGRFFGLRGCESPVAEGFDDGAGTGTGAGDDDDARAVEEQMEKEWQEALRRARCEIDPDAEVRRKVGGY